MFRSIGIAILLITFRVLLSEPFGAFQDTLLAVFEKTTEIVRSAPSPASGIGSIELVPKP